MDMRLGRAALGLTLAGSLALSGCGRAAEAERHDASSESVPAAVEPVQQPLTPVQDQAPPPVAEPAAPAQPSAPARATSRPAAQPSRPTQVSEPVDPRPAEPSRATPSTETRAARRTVAAGSTMDLAVEAKVTTESSKVGDEVSATLSQDVLGDGGEVLLPAGTRLTGHVVESQASTGSDSPAVLRLAFESVTVNGETRPVKASVVEMDVKADTRDSNTRTAAKVGVGAAAGAIAGRIIGGDKRGAVTGAVVGAAAGGAVAATTRSGHATLEQGARVVIRLDEALVVGG
jgi:hypothetical protein